MEFQNISFNTHDILTNDVYKCSNSPFYLMPWNKLFNQPNISYFSHAWIALVEGSCRLDPLEEPAPRTGSIAIDKSDRLFVFGRARTVRFANSYLSGRFLSLPATRPSLIANDLADRSRRPIVSHRVEHNYWPAEIRARWDSRSADRLVNRLDRIGELDLRRMKKKFRWCFCSYIFGFPWWFLASV